MTQFRPVPGIASWFNTWSIRSEDDRVATHCDIRPSLCRPDGSVSPAVVLFTADVACGIAAGLAVQSKGLWTVTTDLHVEMTGPITGSVLRVESEIVRAGATTVVARFVVRDADRGEVVGGGTGNFRPLQAEFDPSWLQFPVGVRLGQPEPPADADVDMMERLGIAMVDGGVQMDLTDWHFNPWGIMHGGATGAIVQAAAAVSGWPAVGLAVRYLAGGKVGPIRAEVVAGDQALSHIEVTDVGADGRRIAIATVRSLNP